MDRFSPVAPAQIRVLVLPVGQIERSRYLAFLERLKKEGAIVQLADLEPQNGDDGERLLAPQTFPQGCLLYNYTVSMPSEQQQQLSPFELFREPLLVLGVKDGLGEDEEGAHEELRAATLQMRERHPRVVDRQLLLLQDRDMDTSAIPEDFIRIRNIEQPQDPSLKQAIRQFSSRFLLELATYMQAMQASPTVQTPGQTAKSLKRNISLKDRERLSRLDYKSPPRSMELSRTDDAGEDGRPSSPPINQSSPPTSFEQMSSTNGSSGRPGRPDSQTSNNKMKSSARNSSPDRISVQGFGSVSATSQEKMKTKGQARVGIVVGYLYLMSGHWDEALRMFVHYTSKLRTLSDHLWHAKGLEGAVVSMLLYAWAGLEFQIPPICYTNSERPPSSNGQRFSIDVSSQFRSASDTKSSPNHQLSASLPDLFKSILSLYYSGEGSLELPFISVADATIRFCKLLATLRNSSGDLNHDLLDSFISMRSASASKLETALPVAPFASPLKLAITDMISYADPSSEESLSVADHVSILAGIASVYALLQMDRKKAIAIKDLIVKLGGAMVQARKRGAAEVGIHPAASPSMDAGTRTLIAITEDSGGLNQMMSSVALTYGIPLHDPLKTETAAGYHNYFGSDSMKLDFARALATFCEAAPDPQGVLLVNASMLRAFGPRAAVDSEPMTHTNGFSKEEQARCIAAISRTLSASKLLHQPQVEAVYWDDFLVRNVEFLPAEPSQAVADLSKMKKGQALEQTPGNPLLYDPHAKRPRTADEIQQTNILVLNEISTCRITLQNPYEISVDVESLSLITEGVELKTSQHSFTLNPSCIQRIAMSVSPQSSGDCKITGCRVKIQGCRERVFPIFSKPWSPTPSALIKPPVEDQDATTDSSKDAQSPSRPEQKTVDVTVTGLQPILTVGDSSMIESTLMLLDGEIHELTLAIRNNSEITASVFDIVTTSDVIQLQDNASEEESDSASETSSEQKEATLIEPGESANFTFDVVGRPTVFQVRIAFHYTAHPNSTHARILSVPINMTVNAGLQVQNLDALPLDIAQNNEYSFVLALDVGNAWPKSLFYSCFVSDLGLKSAEPRRCHNHEGVLAPGQVLRVFMPIARPLELSDSDHDPEHVRKSLLERLRIIWNVEGEERMGEIDASSLTMSTDSLKTVAGEAICISLELVNVEADPSAGPSAKAGSFATLRATLSNRANETYPLVVHLKARGLNSFDSTVSERQIAFTGAQNRFIPPITQGEQAMVDFTFCPLLAGLIEFEAVARVALAGASKYPPWQSQPPWTSHRKFLLSVV